MTIRGFWAMFNEKEKVMGVYVFDVSTIMNTLVSMGRRPVDASDRKTVLTEDLDNKRTIVDVVTRKATKVSWSGDWGGAIALLGDVVLYWGLPTTGSEIRQTILGSRGPTQLVSLKVAKIDSKEFQTVVPYIDPRSAVSFGVVKAKP